MFAGSDASVRFVGKTLASVIRTGVQPAPTELRAALFIKDETKPDRTAQDLVDSA